MARLGSGTAAVFAAAMGLVGAVGSNAAAASAKHSGAPHAHAGTHHHRHHVVRRHADQAAYAGDRHHTHNHAAAGGQGLGVDTTPYITTPYPFDGHVAGDGILRTGILDSNVLRAFGIVPN